MCVQVLMKFLSWAKVKQLLTFENNFLCVVILVIWILFSLPAFFFYISNEENVSGWIGNINNFVEFLEETCIPNITRNYSSPGFEGCNNQSGNKVSGLFPFHIMLVHHFTKS